MMTDVICDYLKLTFPLGECGGLLGAVAMVMADLHAEVESEGIYRLGGGQVRLLPVAQVMTLSLSGGALTVLRDADQLGSFLGLLSEWPHRVTLLDAALDRFGEDGPTVVRRVYARAKRGQVALTRKAIAPAKCRQVLGPDADGVDTGTVYLGQRGSAEVYAKVYDKRKERIDRGHGDPGPWVRYELTVTGKIGPTLRDVYEPTALFWHFMGRTLLKSPVGVAAWAAHAEGYQLPARPVLLPYESLQRRLEASAELRELVLLAKLAGPHGLQAIHSELKRLAATSPVEHADSAARSEVA